MSDEDNVSNASSEDVYRVQMSILADELEELTRAHECVVSERDNLAKTLEEKDTFVRKKLKDKDEELLKLANIYEDKIKRVENDCKKAENDAQRLIEVDAKLKEVDAMLSQKIKSEWVLKDRIAKQEDEIAEMRKVVDDKEELIEELSNTLEEYEGMKTMLTEYEKGMAKLTAAIEEKEKLLASKPPSVEASSQNPRSGDEVFVEHAKLKAAYNSLQGERDDQLKQNIALTKEAEDNKNIIAELRTRLQHSQNISRGGNEKDKQITTLENELQRHKTGTAYADLERKLQALNLQLQNKNAILNTTAQKSAYIKHLESQVAKLEKQLAENGVVAATTPSAPKPPLSPSFKRK